MIACLRSVPVASGWLRGSGGSKQMHRNSMSTSRHLLQAHNSLTHNAFEADVCCKRMTLRSSSMPKQKMNRKQVECCTDTFDKHASKGDAGPTLPGALILKLDRAVRVRRAAMVCALLGLYASMMLDACVPCVSVQMNIRPECRGGGPSPR